MNLYVTDQMVKEYHQNGFVLLRGLLKQTPRTRNARKLGSSDMDEAATCNADWIEQLRRGVAKNMASPSSLQMATLKLASLGIFLMITAIGRELMNSVTLHFYPESLT